MGEYVFDQAWEKERDRLAGLEGWLDPGTIRHLEQIGVAPGWRCLEVGGGGGSITRWLCERVGPAGGVVATDVDTRFLDALDLANLEIRRHDIVNDTLEEEAFDLAHTRLVLMHLPGREDALKRMIAAVRPGGRVLIEDFDMVTHLAVTPSPVYEQVNAAMWTMMQGIGIEVTLGRRLTQLLDSMGLEDVDGEGRIPIGTRTNNPGIEMYKLTLAQLRAPMVQGGLVTDEQLDRVLALLDDPSFSALPPATIAAWGRKPS